MEVADKLNQILASLQRHSGRADALDASTGHILKWNLVEGVRREETVYFKKKDVYTKVSICEAYGETFKAPVGVRWVDFSKGVMMIPTTEAGLWTRTSARS